jgi:hypothetical protein
MTMVGAAARKTLSFHRPMGAAWGISDVGGGGVETSQPGPTAGRRKAKVAPRS